MEKLQIYIGYDPAEPIAYHVAANSIIRHATVPISITPLSLNTIPGYKETHKDGSNEFIYSRFLVPYLSNYEGWSLFIDGDMVVTGDIKELFDLKNPLETLMCVKQPEYKTRADIKYLGNKNESYPKKNWSSVILYNNRRCKALTPEYVMNATGEELHRFYWTKEELIGRLPPEWNHLETEFEPSGMEKLIHYTLGTPCWKDYAQTDLAYQWHNEYLLTVGCKGENALDITSRAIRASTKDIPFTYIHKEHKAV